jgi:hypothetical protein
MAYSKIVITFNSVPQPGEQLVIRETSKPLRLEETFREYRYNAKQVELPYKDTNIIGSSRYRGYVCDFFTTAFNIDYNSGGLFTVTSQRDLSKPNSGIGTVTIIANYPRAVFIADFLPQGTTVTITNEVPVSPPPGYIGWEPKSLNFVYYQNDVLPTLGIAFAGDNWKIEGKPNFLLSSTTPGVTIANVGSGANLYQTISGSGDALVTVSLTDYYNLNIEFPSEALYTAFLIYQNGNRYSDISCRVTVYKLSDFLTVPYVTGEKAFTLDTKYFVFKSDRIDSYFQFDAVIKTYDFFTNALNETTVNQKIVLFKGVQKISIGQLVHRLMRKFLEPNANQIQYKEATLKITCAEKTLFNDSVIRTGVSATIPFLAGLSKGITRMGFLDFNPLPNRVTKNSFAYLNFIVPLGKYEIRIFKNGIQIGTLMSITDQSGTVLSKKVSFSEYNQGDAIQFVLDKVGENNANASKKTFRLAPEGNFSNHIVWENEFLLQSAIECTGTASIVPEGEFQTQLVYVDLVEKLINIASSKNVKLNINTGWLMLSDIDTVESLMRAKRAWLIQGDTFINLVPTGKKLPERNLETELIQFSLEFKINQNYNEETYSL